MNHTFLAAVAFGVVAYSASDASAQYFGSGLSHSGSANNVICGPSGCYALPQQRSYVSTPWCANGRCGTGVGTWGANNAVVCGPNGCFPAANTYRTQYGNCRNCNRIDGGCSVTHRDRFGQPVPVGTNGQFNDWNDRWSQPLRTMPYRDNSVRPIGYYDQRFPSQPWRHGAAPTSRSYHDTDVAELDDTQLF